MFSRNKASTTLSFVLSLIFFLYLTLIYKILQFPFEIQIIGGILLILTIIGYLLWRGMICKIKLPRSGIDFPIAIFLVSVFLSLVFSPNPESGLWRICCFLGLLIFFYGLIDLFNSGILDERAMMAAILVSNGFALFTAVNETVLWYQEWWQRSGSLWTLPIIPYRFTSILSHANVLIAYANLSLPLAVIFFLGTKNRRKKVLYGVWLAFYIIALPFSSSRGGWLGLSVMCIAGLALLLWERKSWRIFQSFPKNKKIITILAVLAILGVIVLLAYWFLITFGSRGNLVGNSFSDSGRSLIWNNALSIWRKYPIFGAGPGRFQIEYQLTTEGAPPVWWAPTAHNIFLQSLAEFGFLGFLGLVTIIISCLIWAINMYKWSKQENKVVSGAILVSLLGHLTGSLFDDFTFILPIVFSVAFMVAWLSESKNSKQSRPPISLNWAWIPSIILIYLLCWSAYSFQPMSGWKKAIQNGGWKEVAELIHQSADRDPGLFFYSTNEGLAWSAEWEFSQNEIHLGNARDAFQKSLSKESGLSLVWANSSVLEWYAGNNESAITKISRAIQIAPNEYSYWLNRGWFREEQGDYTGALDDYARTLELAPMNSNHPFWQLSPTRRDALTSWSQENVNRVEEPAYWQLSQKETINSNLDKAKYFLALSWSQNENKLAQEISRFMIFEKQGDSKGMEETFKNVYEYLSMMNLHYSTDSFATYSFFFLNQPGLMISIVPGYLQLLPDMGQFKILSTMIEYFRNKGENEKSDNVRQLYIQAINGGSLIN